MAIRNGVVVTVLKSFDKYRAGDICQIELKDLERLDGEYVEVHMVEPIEDEKEEGKSKRKEK